MPWEVPRGEGHLLLDPKVKVWVLPYQRLQGLSGGLGGLLGQMCEARRVLLILDEFQLLREVGGHADDPEGPPDLQPPDAAGREQAKRGSAGAA